MQRLECSLKYSISSVLLAVCLVATPSWGAIALRASTTATTTSPGYSNVASTSALAYPINVTAGDLLIAGGCNWNAVTQAMAVTGAPNTWTVVQGADVSGEGGVYKGWIAYSIAASSAAYTPTIDPAGTGNYGSYSLAAFSGVDNASPLDVDGGSTSATNTAQSDSITTGTANALIIGVACGANGGDNPITITPGGSYTQIGEIQATDAAPHNLVYRIVTSATSYTVDFTLGTSRAWNVKTLSFKEATGGGGSTLTPRLMLLGVGP